MGRSANQPLKSKVICCVNAQDYSRNLSILVSKLLAPVYLGACRLVYLIIISYVWRARAAGQARRTPDGPAGRRSEGRGGGLGRSGIDCLAWVQEVGNRHKVSPKSTDPVHLYSLYS